MYTPPPVNDRGSTRPNGKVSLTSDQAASRLITGARWGVAGEPVVVTYGFRASQPAMLPDGVTKAERMTFQQIRAVEEALKIWASVANIRFERVGVGTSGEAAFTDTASMLFTAYSGGDSGTGGFAYYPGDTAGGSPSGDVWINTSYPSNYYVIEYGPGFELLLHEIGHALGLGHPSGYDGGTPTYAQAAEYFEDSNQYTLMSYFGIEETGGNSGSRQIPGGPLIDDIVAIQRLYGANPDTASGNTVYGNFYSQLVLSDERATGVSIPGAPVSGYLIESSDRVMWGAVWDTGGIDTFDFSQSAKDQRIDLRAGAFSNIHGGTGTFAIAPGVVIEDAIGGSGRDEIIGNDVANRLVGNDGADILYGGGGDDRLTGGAGDDLLIGGAGRDVFVFGRSSGGNDRIDDFARADDRIDVGGYRLTGVAEVAGDTVLSYHAGTVTVSGVAGLSLADWNDLRAPFAAPRIVTSIATAVASDMTAKITITLAGTVLLSFGTITLATTDGTVVSEFPYQSSGSVVSRVTASDTSIIEVNLKQPLAADTEYVLTIPAAALESRNPLLNFTGINGYVFTTPPPPPPVVPQFTLVVGVGVQATVTGTGNVAAGAGGVQDITVRDAAGTIGFGATFNEGGDRVHLAGAASAWTVMRSGTSVILSDGDTNVRLPAGTVGTDVIFADGVRTLKIDVVAGAIMLGAQAVTTSVEKVGSYPGPAIATTPTDPGIPAQLLLSGAGPVTAIGTLTVAGSPTTAETVVVASGARAAFGATFSAGGDTIVLPGMAPSYQVYRSGSTVVFTSGAATVSMPASVTGIQVAFGDGSQRLLYVDTVAGAVKLGASVVGTTPTTLAVAAAAFGDDLAVAPPVHQAMGDLVGDVGLIV